MSHLSDLTRAQTVNNRSWLNCKTYTLIQFTKYQQLLRPTWLHTAPQKSHSFHAAPQPWAKHKWLSNVLVILYNHFGICLSGCTIGITKGLKYSENLDFFFFSFWQTCFEEGKDTERLDERLSGWINELTLTVLSHHVLLCLEHQQQLNTTGNSFLIINEIREKNITNTLAAKFLMNKRLKN